MKDEADRILNTPGVDTGRGEQWSRYTPPLSVRSSKLVGKGAATLELSPEEAPPSGPELRLMFSTSGVYGLRPAEAIEATQVSLLQLLLRAYLLLLGRGGLLFAS